LRFPLIGRICWQTFATVNASTRTHFCPLSTTR
jgi:hypothetical protein